MARMAIGHLSMSDSIGSTKNSVSTPLRAMAYADSVSDAGATFVQPSAQSIIDGSYVIYQNETYVTVRKADGSYANNDPNTDCPNSPIVPLTNNKAKLQTAITNLQVDGNTYGNVGMAWGYHVISPGAPFTKFELFETMVVTSPSKRSWLR